MTILGKRLRCHEPGNSCTNDYNTHGVMRRL
jgi:hypothetical protein